MAKRKRAGKVNRFHWASFNLLKTSSAVYRVLEGGSLHEGNPSSYCEVRVMLQCSGVPCVKEEGVRRIPDDRIPTKGEFQSERKKNFPATISGGFGDLPKASKCYKEVSEDFERKAENGLLELGGCHLLGKRWRNDSNSTVFEASLLLLRRGGVICLESRKENEDHSASRDVCVFGEWREDLATIDIPYFWVEWEGRVRSGGAAPQARFPPVSILTCHQHWRIQVGVLYSRQRGISRGWKWQRNAYWTLGIGLELEIAASEKPSLQREACRLSGIGDQPSGRAKAQPAKGPRQFPDFDWSWGDCSGGGCSGEGCPSPSLFSWQQRFGDCSSDNLSDRDLSDYNDALSDNEGFIPKKT